MKVPVKFPENAELLIQAGQTVDFGTPFLRKKATSAIRVPLSEILNFPPDKIFLSLKKVVGDAVQKGDLIAEHKGMFSTKQYFSSVDGVIREIDHLTGTMTIELESGEENVIPSFVMGEVDSIGDGYIELKVNKAKKIDIEESTHYLGGPIYYIADIEKPLTEDDIYEKIIVGHNVNPLDHAKIETLGAKGFVSSTKVPLGAIKQITIMNTEDLEELMKEQYPYFITGVDKRTVYFYE